MTPTTQPIDGILTGSGIVPQNKLENRESNYDITIAKRKKVEKEQPRFDILNELLSKYFDFFACSIDHCINGLFGIVFAKAFVVFIPTNVSGIV